MERRRKHFTKASAGWVKAAVFHNGAQVQSIARARHRNIQKAFRLFAVAIRLVFIRARLEIANRYRHFLACVARDPNRIPPIARAA